MQRLHEYDLVGHVLEQEAWEVAGPSGVRTSGPPESSGSGETGGGEIWGRRRPTQTIHSVANARLVQAASVWATAFGVDPEFWLEKQFGHRICARVDAG